MKAEQVGDPPSRNVVPVSSSTLPSRLGGFQGGAREENEIPACIYSSPYFPSILTRRQTVVINFISDCLPKALVDVTRNLTVEIIVDTHTCVHVYVHTLCVTHTIRIYMHIHSFICFVTALLQRKDFIINDQFVLLRKLKLL